MNKRLLCVLALIAITSLLMSLTLGSVFISPVSLWKAITGLSDGSPAAIILKSIRLPRTLAAVIAGLGLSVSGLLLQCVTGNSLAGPNIIGVNSGAGFFVALCLMLFPRRFEMIPIFAFSGAFLVSSLITLLSGGTGGKYRVILAGIGCTSLFQAAISFITSLDNDVLSMYGAFALGSLSGVTIDRLIVPGYIVFAGFALTLIFSRRIEVLTMGDELASSLGVEPACMRVVCLVIASACAAATVSFAGLLGFVGLVVPHVARRVTRGILAQTLSCAAIGSCIVALSDLLGRTLFSPGEVQVGVVMAFIGAPWFLILLFRENIDHAGF